MNSKKPIKDTTPAYILNLRDPSGTPAPFAGSTFLSLVKLVLGVLVLMTLFSTLMFLCVFAWRIVEGDSTPSTIGQLALASVVSASLFFLLYLLARKPRSKHNGLEEDQITRLFARRKLLFQASTLLMIALAIAGLIAATRLPNAGPLFVSLVVTLVSLGYWALGHTLWRCPNCKHRLSFHRSHRDSQTITRCPACGATLQ